MLPRSLLKNLQSIWLQRALIWQLARHQIKQQYAATVIGTLWAIIQPVATMLVFWFVFAYGFKMQFGSSEIPYFLVLFCGFIPWMMFSEALSGGTGSIIIHGYLVKKIAFPLEILPIVHIVAACIVHVGMLIFLLLILLLYGIFPGLHALQLVYFLAATLVFLVGLTWTLSALNVFQRDIGQALGVLTTLWFWLTPIVWPIDQINGWARRIIELNPLYYVIQGYRNALLFDEPLFADWQLGIYFWCVSLLLVLVGGVVFHRLKPHFADVM